MIRPTDLSDLRIDLEQALDRLTPRQRQAVELYAGGMSQEEVAEKMGVTQQFISKRFQCLVVKMSDFSTLSYIEDKCQVFSVIALVDD